MLIIIVIFIIAIGGPMIIASSPLVEGKPLFARLILLAVIPLVLVGAVRFGVMAENLFPDIGDTLLFLWRTAGAIVGFLIPFVIFLLIPRRSDPKLYSPTPPHLRNLTAQYACTYTNSTEEIIALQDNLIGLAQRGKPAADGIAMFFQDCARGTGPEGWWLQSAQLTKLISEIPGIDPIEYWSALVNEDSRIWEYATTVRAVATGCIEQWRAEQAACTAAEKAPAPDGAASRKTPMGD